MLPKFLLNAHFREYPRFSGRGRAEITLPAALIHLGPPSIHLRPESAMSPRPGRSHRCGSTGRSLSVGRGGQCQRNAVLVAFEGTELPWAAAVPLQCHVGACRRSGVTLLSPCSLLRARPPARAEGWQPPGALPGRAGPLDGFCSEPPYPAPRPGKDVGSECGASRGRRAG